MKNIKNSVLPKDIPRDNGGFFTKDKAFYKTFFRLMILLVLQNVLTYAVNVADNILLGAYNQSTLSAVEAVNQIQYILQQFTIMGLGEGLIVIASHYWGKKDTKAIKKLSQIAMFFGVLAGIIVTAICFISPLSIIKIFTNDPLVQKDALEFLSIIRYSYIVFIITSILIVTLRSMQIVSFAFKMSIATMIINLAIDYVLVYGRFGAPELGIIGSAIGTLAARIIEFFVVLIYYIKKTSPNKIKPREIFNFDKDLLKDYLNVSVPCVMSALLFSCATAIHTAIFGHISSDAMAASSAVGTLFQFLKMVPVGAASAASVLIGELVGSQKYEKLRAYVKTLQILFLAIGVIIGICLLILGPPILSLYKITPNAKKFAMQMILIQSVICVGTSYEMPSQIGIIRSGGDTRYVMISDMIYSWLFTVPFGLLSAFVFKLPLFVIVIVLNCDQIIKCLTVGIKVNSFTWVKKLTKEKQIS